MVDQSKKELCCCSGKLIPTDYVEVHARLWSRVMPHEKHAGQENDARPNSNKVSFEHDLPLDKRPHFGNERAYDDRITSNRKLCL